MGQLDEKDVDAIAAISVNLKRGVLGQRALPSLHELGIEHPVGSASADVLEAKTAPARNLDRSAKAFAEANPTGTTRDASVEDRR